MDSEAIKFKEACERENAILAAITEKEIVSEEMAFEALIITKNMKLLGVGDALIYAAALSTLNTYVKQSKENKKQVGYSFKKNVDVLTKYIVKNPSELIHAEVQKDKDMSLCMVEIGGIQFSYHNVEMNSYNKKLAVKEGEETIAWDGIRKQTCAVTVFDFAMASDYDRGNKMMDDSDFIEGLNSTVAEYREGTKTIADAKKMMFGSNKTGAGSAKVETAETVVYPYRNEPIAPLYQGTVDAVKQELKKRTFVEYLAKEYEQDYGFTLPKITEIEWKYAMESLARVLDKLDVNPDAGMRIDCCRFMGLEYLTVLFVSTNDNATVDIAAVQMLSWEEMKYEEDGSVTYSDYDSNVKLKTMHPSSLARLYAAVVFKGIVNNPRYDIRPCVFMYDASLKGSTDIVSNCDDEYIKNTPVFYTNDAKTFGEYITEAVNGGNGRSMLSEINKMHDEYADNDVAGVSDEHRYITEKIVQGMGRLSSGLLVLNNRKAKDNDAFMDYLRERLDNAGSKYCYCRNDAEAEAFEIGGTEVDAVLYYDFVPDSINFERCPVNAIIVDEYALYQEDRCRLTYFIEQTSDLGIPRMYYEPAHALGYKDNGSGNTWLIRNLTLGDIGYQKWIPSIYSIEVVDDTSEFTKEDGIANVTIPASITYDQEKHGIRGVYDEKTDLYRELTEGINGVQLYIENEELRVHIAKEIEESKNHVAWLDSLIRNADGDISECISNVRSALDNTNSYNTYELIAKQSLGIGAWNKMQQDSQDWIVSALLSFSDMKNTDPLMDFSGVTLMVSKTFENELTRRYCEQYEAYLQKKYGDRYIDELPEALYEINQFGEKKVFTSNRLTLGSIPFVMGMDSKGNVKNEHEYANFKDFCKDELLTDKDSIDGTLREICEIVYYVRVNFRNKSAHKDVIDIMVATDCMEYCITKQRKLGCLLDYFNEEDSSAITAASGSADTAAHGEMDEAALTFIKACEDENKILAAIDVKEDVPEEIALKAEIVINNMDIRGVGDVLLYASSLNVLNTYVKLNEENHEAVGYSFKRKVDEMVRYLAANPSPMVKGEVQQERGMSLFMMEVNTIQFSYHQIELNNDFRKFIAKDIDNPELKWDGIRKQMCSVSAFEFALANKYGRSHKMLDGTDFDEGLKTLVDKYHAGTFNIEDSKHSVYGNAEQQCQLKINVGSGEGDVLKDLPIGILFTSDGSTFTSKAKDGSLVEELVKTCTEGLGFELREDTKDQWHKAISGFTSSIHNIKLNPDVGIRVLYVKYFGQDQLLLEIASMSDPYKCNIAIVWLVPWNKMRLVGNDTVIVTDGEHGELKCAHPSKALQMFMQSVTHGIFNNQKYYVKPCVLLYDAVRGEDTDIVSYYYEDDIKRVPVFYKGDEAAFCDAVRTACTGKHGPKVVEEMEQMLDGYLLPVDGGLANEHRYIIDAIAGKLWDTHKTVIMINLHKAKGCTLFEDELVRRLEEAGEKCSVYGIEGVKEKEDPDAKTVIYSGILPAEHDFAKAPRCILIMDKNRFSKARREELDAFLDASRKGGARIDSYRPSMHLGYKDYGCGICWIMRILDIGYEKSRGWIPELYSIKVIDKKAEFNDTAGIANVTIDYPYTIDMFKNEIHGSAKQKLEIYEQLITGTDGAVLKISDTALRTHVSNYLEVDRDRFYSMKESAGQ